MINFKKIYHVDDIVLSNFCPNTFKVDSKDRYQSFKKMLHTFHKIPKMYEDTLESYSAYIAYAILMNSLELNKNILSYETYFFNVLTGFASARKQRRGISTKVAKLWGELVVVYEKLLHLTQTRAKEVETLTQELGTTHFINCKQVPNNYYWDVPIKVLDVDNHVTRVLILPSTKKQNIYSNYTVLSTIAKYPNQDLIVIRLFLDDLKYEVQLLNITAPLVRWSTQAMENLFTDYEKASLSNCTICPVAPCSTALLEEPTQPRFDTRKLKVKGE